VPWTDIPVLIAAALPQTITRTIKTAPEIDLGKEALKLGLTLITGIPMMGGGKKEETRVVRSSDVIQVFDVAAPGLRLRVAADNFDYSGLGHLKSYGAAADFNILFGEIAKRAPKAVLNRGARLLLDGKPLRAPLAQGPPRRRSGRKAGARLRARSRRRAAPKSSPPDGRLAPKSGW